MIDAYFSGTKIAWILDRYPEARAMARDGRVVFGTIDSWLLWKLTGGDSHSTDPTNASRTLLYDIHERRWHPELLEVFQVPEAMLPAVKPSSGVVGQSRPCGALPGGVAVAGVAGDQQAALYEQGCWDVGTAKNTYGTGCFLVMNMGEHAPTSQHGLLTTICCDADGRPAYALEGSIFVAGAAVQWLRDELGFVSSASETEDIAASVPDTQGVYVVPAFVGLGAPHWDPHVRGAILGLTRGAGRREIVRATLESIAYQTRDVVDAMNADSGVPLSVLRVDGGAAANGFLMQFQADLLGVPVDRPAVLESTAVGAALLAGLGVGLWESPDALADVMKRDRRFEPAMDPARARTPLRGLEAGRRPTPRGITPLTARGESPASHQGPPWGDAAAGPSKARRARIPGVLDRGAMRSAGMLRRSTAGGLLPRAARRHETCPPRHRQRRAKLGTRLERWPRQTPQPPLRCRLAPLM